MLKKNRKIWIWLPAVCMVLNLTGCSAAGNGFRDFEQDGRIRVVTTIYPIYDFVQNIAGERAEIINLVPAGIEPHDFELSTGDMRLLEQAEMFVYNGAGMEHFVGKTLEALSNEELAVIEAAADITPLQAEDGEADPHTWLSVPNAIKEAERIKDAFVELDGESAEFYEANFTVYKEKLEILDKEYREELDKLPGDTIVVAHEAFGYLCSEYGLKQEAVEGLMPDSEPEPAKMKEIIDFCRDNHVRVIFFEELNGSKVAEAIARETGAEIMVLNPIESLTAEQQGYGLVLDYIHLMQLNLLALKKALEVGT